MAANTSSQIWCSPDNIQKSNNQLCPRWNNLKKNCFIIHYISQENNVFMSVFFFCNKLASLKRFSHAFQHRKTTSLNQASALNRLEPRLHSNVYVSKTSTCPSQETREELLGLHRPWLNRLLWLTKEGLSAKVLRKRSGRWYARRQGSPQLACFRVN